MINQGLLLSTSLMAAIADRSFHLRGPQFGVYTGGKTNFSYETAPSFIQLSGEF